VCLFVSFFDFSFPTNFVFFLVWKIYTETIYFANTSKIYQCSYVTKIINVVGWKLRNISSDPRLVPFVHFSLDHDEQGKTNGKHMPEASKGFLFGG